VLLNEQNAAAGWRQAQKRVICGLTRNPAIARLSVRS
jgi:hypothetical protein